MSRIAVLIPCYNEALTVEKVVRDFKKALPAAEIYVYDNNSKDDTGSLAKKAGALVRTERRQGKGWVVRSMFSEIDADYYIMVDGDATYEASIIQDALAQVESDRLDLLNIARAKNNEAFRTGHQLGNSLFNMILKTIFGSSLKDMLSGYKIFSRKFVKNFPALSAGFEVETELTIFAFSQGMKIREIEAPFHDRPEGSFSKLSTFKDGFKVLIMIIRLLRYEKPFLLFSTIALILFLVAITLAAPILTHYLETGLVPRLPTAVLCSGITIVAVLSFFAGLILDQVTRTKKEIQRFFYINTR